jgi:hypothetical protein
VRAGLAVVTVVTVLVVTVPGGVPAPAAGIRLDPGGVRLVATAVRTTPAPRPSTAQPSVAGVPGWYGEQEPTAQQVAESQRRAAELHARMDAQAGQLGQARAALTAAARQASIALERYSTAASARHQAQLAQDQAEQALLQAQLDLAAQRAVLGRWARQAYADGVGLSDYPAVATVLRGGSTDDLGTTMLLLARVGASKSRAVEGLARAKAAQGAAVEDARDAAAAADAAAVIAEQASTARDAAVRAQQQTVSRLESNVAATATAAGQADDEAEVLARARAAAEREAGFAAGRGGAPRDGRNLVTGPVGECAGGDLGRFGNGRIPLSALCPLATASGEYLRADAAFSFDRLSRAYAVRFGTPICVTDSYRSYDEQVRVYAERPRLAARPGTSNHGWGTAADLCGGIERFSTDTHDWLLLHAPLFGWFHPAWAEPDGSMPEPWHWEFGG